MEEIKNVLTQLNRRDFLTKAGLGLGSIALGSLLGSQLSARERSAVEAATGFTATTRGADFSPRAKRINDLFMRGGPSQLQTFDYKPALAKWHGQDIPDSIRGTQRNSGMVLGQS